MSLIAPKNSESIFVTSKNILLQLKEMHPNSTHKCDFWKRKYFGFFACNIDFLAIMHICDLQNWKCDVKNCYIVGRGKPRLVRFKLSPVFQISANGTQLDSGLASLSLNSIEILKSLSNQQKWPKNILDSFEDTKFLLLQFLKIVNFKVLKSGLLAVFCCWCQFVLLIHKYLYLYMGNSIWI